MFATKNDLQKGPNLIPLFWQHAEEEALLRREVAMMHSVGIDSFIVESRPHPDFLGELWWRDVDILMDECRKRGMKLWIFDDNAYPSGFVAGKIRDNTPEYLKTYLDMRWIDAKGPLPGRSFLVSSWLQPGETLLGVAAAQRNDAGDSLDSDTLIDLSAQLTDGTLYWDVPAGNWRVFLFVVTREGGEEWTKDYLNPLIPEAAQAYIRFVYEAHYARYGADFGDTFAGFFSDEPRFGNAPTYEGTLGITQALTSHPHKMVLPHSKRLMDELQNVLGADMLRKLPLLWMDADKGAPELRYLYMDLVSKLYRDCFAMPLGDWCRAHNVEWIGHVVEDNGAHARLGFGSGHFYRAISGYDMSGLDIVYQIWPEQTAGRLTTPFGNLDNDFFYWGLAKMASSCGHTQPHKKGRTVAEIFGAYGWQEGLKLMKWLTDHACVRGINRLVPHAFSPRKLDPDCPPHFYGAGLNPQWRYFGYWSHYADRLCSLLSGGKHVASVAVLYHAEAEWMGAYMPFEMPVKALALAQIDCDVVCMDTLREVAVTNQALCINGEHFGALIVPYAQKLPETSLARLRSLAAEGLPILYLDALPEGIEDADVCTLEALPERLEAFRDIQLSDAQPDLRFYHYTHGSEALYFFTNEGIRAPLCTEVTFRETRVPRLYDAMTDQQAPAQYRIERDRCVVTLTLPPYGSVFVVFSDEAADATPYSAETVAQETTPALEWTLSLAKSEDYPHFTPWREKFSLTNLAAPGLLPRFSGTVRYEATFHCPEDAQKLRLSLGECFEIAELTVNGVSLGARICPPYVFDISEAVRAGENTLCIDVTNTLAKEHGDNVFDRAMAQEPTGLIGPVRLQVLQHE